MVDAKNMVDADEAGLLTTLRNLWPYMWPSERSDLKRRVVYAALFMVLGKLVTKPSTQVAATLS